MDVRSLSELNQRYVRLTDRCRSQWTFYQFLQGAFKHFRGVPCPLKLDFQELFARLRAQADLLANPETSATEQSMHDLGGELDRTAARLLRTDSELPPSLLRRFFDRLRQQDEKVLLALIKFYLAVGALSEDQLDKLDILFTRLAEVPLGNGLSRPRERHEIERLVRPLLQQRRAEPADERDVEAFLDAIAALKGEILGVKDFNALIGGGSLDRFRALKRRLGERLLDPRLLPAMIDATIALKSRFGELWALEEQLLLDDTNRVREAKRQLALNPELLTPEFRQLFDLLDVAQQRFDKGREQETMRLDDIAALRGTLDRILTGLEAGYPTGQEPEAGVPAVHSAPIVQEPEEGAEEADAASAGQESEPVGQPLEEITPIEIRELPHRNALGEPIDPLLHEHVSKILFAFELVGNDRPAAELVHAKEVAGLRLEPWEVDAIRRVAAGRSPEETLAGQRDRLSMKAAALRIRIDEEAREIHRLRDTSSEHLPNLLERATQSLQRAAELERRYQWFVDDALYRGDVKHLEELFRSRMRLLRAYAGLWLIHNDSGGISPY